MFLTKPSYLYEVSCTEPSSLVSIPALPVTPILLVFCIYLRPVTISLWCHHYTTFFLVDKISWRVGLHQAF